MTMVAIPGNTDQSVQQSVQDHCTRLHDRFAILDSLRGAAPFSGTISMEDQRAWLIDARRIRALLSVDRRARGLGIKAGHRASFRPYGRDLRAHG